MLNWLQNINKYGLNQHIKNTCLIYTGKLKYENTKQFNSKDSAGERTWAY